MKYMKMSLYVCGMEHEKDYDWRQSQVSLKLLGMWLHGAASNLCWGGQTPGGSNCGSWYVSKNKQPPSSPLHFPPLFFIADADLCLSSDGSNYWVRGKDAPPFYKTTANHPMTDSLRVWLRCWTEKESEKVQQWQRGNWIRGLKRGRVTQSG